MFLNCQLHGEYSEEKLALLCFTKCVKYISKVFSSWANLMEQVQTHTTLLSVTLCELDINPCMDRQWLQHLMVLLGLVARLPQSSGRQSAETYLAPSVLAPATAGRCPTKRSTMESFVIHSLVRKTFQVGSVSSCSHLPTWRLKVDCGP